MEKEQEIFKDANGILKCTKVYTTNVCILNELIIRGELEIIIMMIIKNLEDDDETTFCIEIYNNNVPEDIIENNYIQLNFDYREIQNYSFNNELLKAIIQTINNVNVYKL